MPNEIDMNRVHKFQRAVANNKRPSTLNILEAFRYIERDLESKSINSRRKRKPDDEIKPESLVRRQRRERTGK